MTVVFMGENEIQTQKDKGEIWGRQRQKRAIQLQAKECQGLPATTRGYKRQGRLLP